MEETKQFENVTLYLSGMFGIGATTCKTLKITTGVKYAQYDNAIRIVYFEPRKRNGRQLILDYEPWLRVVETAHAIKPADPLIANGDGSKVSRYSSFDPRYVTDFEDLLASTNTPVILAIGEGRRPGPPITISKYRVVQMVDGRMVPWETEDILAAMEVRGIAQTGIAERPALRPELHGQPTFAGFCGPMWDGDAVRYEDSESNERLSI